MLLVIWKKCLKHLQNELSPTEFSMWIRPLKAKQKNNTLALYAPNKFALDWIQDNYINNFNKLMHNFCDKKNIPLVILKIREKSTRQSTYNKLFLKKILYSKQNYKNVTTKKIFYYSNTNVNNTFHNFITGKSNRLAFNTAYKIINSPGQDCFNPLFLYSSTGLGKTHLLHAIANTIIQNNNPAKVIYTNSECFIQNMITSLRNNTIEEFKQYYRSVEILLIDDIQFFAYKIHSQEELFHTFNSLLEKNQQIIVTSDQFPQKIKGIETRLKSRFECGLTIRIDPPDLETRIQILIKKSNIYNIDLPYQVAFFIAKKLKSNIRELEYVINKILSSLNSKKKLITIDFAVQILEELFLLPTKSITIKNIQQTVSNYYNITTLNLISKSRLQSIVKPRQIAMAISKQLTNQSLCEIGHAFRRNHATVLYAYKKIKKLQKENINIKQDCIHLIKILSS